MFDLETAIEAWKREMTATGIAGTKLEELEGHLREDFGALQRRGEEASRAFEMASAKLGSPQEVEEEFGKISKLWQRPLVIGGAILGVLAAAMFIYFGRAVYRGRVDLLLGTHIVIITIAYATAFTAGIMGCWQIARPSPALWRAMGFFVHVGFGLTICGTVLGAFWLRQHRNAYWGGTGPELGGFNAICWLAAACAAHQFGRAGNRTATFMCVAGNVVVAQGWFGPFVVKSPTPLNYWPVAVFIGVNLCFLLWGLRRKARADLKLRAY